MCKSLKQDKLIFYDHTEGNVEDPCKQYHQTWRIIEANLEAIYKVVLSICDPVLKDQVCKHEDYEEIDN